MPPAGARRRKICRAAYFKTFFNPATGVLAGWRSADGQLHDYCFLYVNGIAIHYGLVPTDQAEPIMDRLMAKMKEVGFNRFDLGLPGNLVPIPMKDYRGTGESAVRRRRRRRTAPRVSSTTRTAEPPPASPISRSPPSTIWAGASRPTKSCCPCSAPSTATISRAAISSTASKDWKSWDGAAFGYEGYLADNYYALLSVLAREGLLRK